MHIKDILHQMPAVPPMLTTKQQVEKLFNDKKDFGVSSAELSQSQLMRERCFLRSFFSDKNPHKMYIYT